MATIKKPKAPKYKKFPPQPKTKSVDALKAWEKRVDSVTKENEAKLADYNKKLAAIDKIERDKKSIVSKAKSKIEKFKTKKAK